MEEKMPLKISLQYFANLREKAGLQRETLSTLSETARELYRELQERHGFSLDDAYLRVVVNESFVGLDERLRDGDEVAFIPPVAGG